MSLNMSKVNEPIYSIIIIETNFQTMRGHLIHKAHKMSYLNVLW